MSFYQPSLSLYDVLNALAGAQTPNRDVRYSQGPQEVPQRAQWETQPRPHYPAYGRSRGPIHAGRRHPFRNIGGIPSTYHYGVNSDPHYYRPVYYYTGDEDSENDTAPEEKEEENEENFESQYVRDPAYYQSRPPRETYGASVDRSGLQELLGSLFGIPSSAIAETPEGQTDEFQKRQRTTEPVNLEEKPEKKPADTDEQPFAKESEVDSKQGSADGETENKTESKPPIHAAHSFRKRPSFLHQQIRSPVPDPLQVSKPETRLDLPFSPELNVYDCKDAYNIAVALPGATSKDFNVDYHPSSHELIIKGNLADKSDISEEFLKISELKYGAFQRTLKFPVLPRIMDEEIKATYKNGLLQIKVPKLIDGSEIPAPKKRIIIEEVPDEELEFEENPNPVKE